MSKDRLLYIQHLQSDPLFKRFITDELARLRPSIPSWNAHEDNTKIWQEKSSQQSGFDLAMTVLEIKPDKT